MKNPRLWRLWWSLVYVCFGLLGIMLALWIGSSVFFNLPVSTDEGSYLFQTYTLRDGQLVRPYPPMGKLLRRADDMLIMDPSVGWVSRYPPGHALWLLPGAFMGIPWVMVALACGLSVIVLMLLARQLGASPLFVGFLLLVSPFFLIMHGTLLSHASGFLSVSVMLWAYMRFQQRGCLRFGVIAGLAWSLLFLNRTYTAFLIAIPFGVDALWQLVRHRNRTVLMQTICFAGSACVGLLGYVIYNAMITGDPRLPTYLLYDSTQTLGFGLRHLHGLPVDHSFLRGLSNTWVNLLELDVWLLGIPFGFVAIIMLAIPGWSMRWGGLLWGGFLALVGGYVFFWFPGPRHIGPAYYFEGLPFLVLLAACGYQRVYHWTESWGQKRNVAVAVVALLVIAGSLRFMDQQKTYFNEVLATQRVLVETLGDAPPDALIFFRNIQYPPFGKITLNEHGLRTDPLVLSCPGAAYHADVMEHFPGRSAYVLEGGAEDQLVAVDLRTLPAQPRLFVDAAQLPRFTGGNEIDAYGGGRLRVARGEDDEAHYLAYGFRRFLPPGEYVAKFHIVSAAGTAGSSARLDVSTDLGRVLLAVAPVPDVAEEEIVELPFIIPDENFLQVEPRVFFGGTGSILLRAISIRRIDV